jgi:hypothetical protein
VCHQTSSLTTQALGRVMAEVSGGLVAPHPRADKRALCDAYLAGPQGGRWRRETRARPIMRFLQGGTAPWTAQTQRHPQTQASCHAPSQAPCTLPPKVIAPT